MSFKSFKIHFPPKVSKKHFKTFQISNYFIKRYKKEQKEAGIPYEAGHYVRRRRVYEEEEEFENNGIGTPHYDEDGNYVGDYVEVVEEIPDWDQEVYNQAERKRVRQF